MEPAVEIIDVTKSFAEITAVKSVNLKIQAGEFFSLLGPSGCGKTTLLRMIAGFEEPTRGIIKVAGVDMTHAAPHKRPVNMVFQNYALFPHLTVFENVAFGLRITKRYQNTEIKSMVEQALNLVRLPNVHGRYPSELSGGQQQRVAFARAIVNKPNVLLLDEPLSALDPKTRQEMQDELARFKKELSMTFIMVTHDQREAFALSDQIAVLSQGNLEQIGSPSQIYNEPKTAFVADFIGQNNMFNAKIIALKNNYVQVEVTEDLVFWAKLSEVNSNLSLGQLIKIWIRNDSLFKYGNHNFLHEKEFINSFISQVQDINFLGSHYEVKLSPNNGQLVFSALIKSDEKQTHSISVGDKIEIQLPAHEIGVLPVN
jgi:spermidine/putrescine transport system ATP-binding protein